MFKKLFLTAVIMITFIVPLTPVFADNTPAVKDGVVRLVNPIGGKDDGTAAGAKGNVDGYLILGGAVRVALGLLGSITLLVFFYGGFMWVTSAGNSDKVSKGTKSMLYAVIGLFIIFGAYGILNTVISGIRGNAIDKGTPDTNTIPFGPENNPTPAIVCRDLNRDECSAKQGCTYFIFHFPENTIPSVTECIETSNRDQQCLEKHAECLEAIAQDLGDPKDCNDERDLCMRL